ncbi:hypothetical protein [Parenemella sanctibonifatiensis]|uniref:Uncharacterized protein n=1 Tax=Parenemella sanctibonifatiensis TaxID=2016505 RepID=A0A255EMV9_9ACTN|nr:hypothetical protein [Parenemella sanctibonifatiensis]OYN89453.1 hypothetical protein CGZ91_11215 [Parenemella sanctibonifatiensis]
MTSAVLWRPASVVDAFEDLPWAAWLAYGVVTLLLALLPMIIGSLLLRRRAHWHWAVAPTVTAVVAVAVFVARTM